MLCWGKKPENCTLDNLVLGQVFLGTNGLLNEKFSILVLVLWAIQGGIPLLNFNADSHTPETFEFLLRGSISAI